MKPLEEHSVISNTGVILEYMQRIAPIARRILSSDWVYTRPPVAAVTVPHVPIFADASCFLECIGLSVGPNIVGISLSLEYLQGQTKRGVVRNMTMHQPSSWIVGFEGDDDEAVSR
jgi:hypothetical protein